MVGFGFVHDVLMGRSPLGLIAVKQSGSAPPLKYCRKFPAEIDGICDSHIHSITAERRMQMAGISGEKYSTHRIAIRQQPTRHPNIGAQHLIREIDAGGLANELTGFIFGVGHAARNARRHEVPQITLVHRPDQTRNILIYLPVHDSRSMAVRLRESGSAEDGVVISRQAECAQHSRSDAIANDTVGTIRSDQILCYDDSVSSARRISNTHADAFTVLFEI